ncbi:MAG TPA: glycosyltransferase family 2 protein [Candidatus Acidoferrum sp.]|nr:glycosyltransferase family 2 protein [Candidatus Acidoferrum sp.]
MHTFGLVVFLLIAAFWVLHGFRAAYGATKLPWIKDFAPAEDTACPSISLIFAARDEEEKLPAALATLAALDYPRLEIIGVDDRSQDRTGGILDDFAAAHPRFRVVHVTELPAGWLGKPHALQKAYEVSTGEWLLLTDADVRFRPDVLRRAVRLAEERKLDHLTLVCNVEMHGFWETMLLTFFGLAFHLSTDAYSVSNPNSRAYVGIGAFQLLRRSAYEAIGTHKRLAMEVVDDMKLGKLVKQSGFRSCVAIAQDFVSVRWHAGARNVIRGVTKNLFAALGYNLSFAVVSLTGVFVLNVVPFFSVFAAHGWIRIFSAIAVVVAICMQGSVGVVNKVSPLYALTHPIGAVLFCYMIVRSVTVTLWQGGVTWRGTFYPLKELKRGLV